ncbi:MAG: group 1 truncated hemoglobin, partial [Betaproteobacteria bacterium]|nr:group 1 truncated hemoglobin [Betaproteobacteria bacterium]
TFAQEGAKVSDPEAFKAFGEKPGLVKIMDDFMVNLLSDPRTKTFFENADQKRVKEQLVEQFCEILNGPCVYKGARMKPIHKELNLTRENFNALVEQLQFAMDKNNVPFTAQNKLLAILAPMHRDIVTR